MVVSGMVLGQGTIRGVVSDAQGETLIGATVVLKSAPSVGVITDLDGRYSLELISAVPETLVVSFVGFKSTEIPVAPRNGEVVIVNVELASGNIELEAVEVVGKARRSGDTYLDRMKAQAPSGMDFISRDGMLKSGDSDAASAVKRVTGVSTVGAFVTVRGLADRYLVTTLNSSRIPTLDPFTNNLRLDLFPTGMMDNIIITKSQTPDLPGDWSGAYLSMNTSDYPDRLQVSFATTVGYNANSTFKNIVSAGTSPTDRFGRDDGTRGIPSGLPAEVDDYPMFIDPNLYQQLGLLGQQGLLNNYGIQSTTPGFSSGTMSTNNVLQHVMLVGLGLLPAGFIHNPSAVQDAVASYNSTYDLAYFSPLVNGDLASYNTKWDNSRWRVGTADADPNYNFSLNIGNQLDLKRKKGASRQLGYLVGFRYSTETLNDEGATITRTIERFEDETPGDQFKRQGEQRVSQVSHGWNVLGNLGFKLDRNNSFSLMAMGNVLGQNNARYLVFLDQTVSGETFVSEDQFWEQRRLWVFQYGSKHYIPALAWTVTADASYSNGGRDVLDLMTVQYVQPPPGQPIIDVDGALTPPGRIFRFLNEEMLDTKLGVEIPLGGDPAIVRKLKLGGSHRWNQRTNDQRYYVVLGAPGPAQWEEPGRFEMRPDGRFTSTYAPFGSFKDNDIGILTVAGFHAMTDYAFDRRLRFAGGLRVEHTDLVSDIFRFWEEGIAADDPIRGTVGDISINGASAPEPKPAVPGTIDQWDILPSANLIYRIRDNASSPTNLRLGYFRSLGRPSFREFSVVQYYDYLLQAPVFGNPELRMTSIDNYDLRVEHFMKNGDNVSISGFYKYFVDHIELLQTAAGGFTWRNAERSEVIGLELEGRFKLVPKVEWRGNITLMNSRSDLSVVLNDELVEYSTPMFGQAPYIVNSMFTYSLDSLKLNLSVSYNVQGPKLAISNAELDPTGIRAYEMPRHLVDITLNKRFGTHWSVLFRVRDLLNQPIRRSYLFVSGYDVDFDRFTWGTEYLLTLAYTIR